MPYHHTQSGIWIVTPCLVFAAFDAFIVWRTGQFAPIAIAIFLVVVAFAFSSLTTEVNGHELTWYFGPGWWKYRIALHEVQSIAAVRNHWWNGWGIRTGAGFTLYNVAGLDAVELKLGSGEVRRIGTDDVQGLLAALRPSSP